LNSRCGKNNNSAFHIDGLTCDVDIAELFKQKFCNTDNYCSGYFTLNEIVKDSDHKIDDSVNISVDDIDSLRLS